MVTRRSVRLLLALLAVQAACGSVFLWDIVSTFLGLGTAPISWRLREVIEIAAAIGLVLGSALGAVAIRRSLDRAQHLESQLRVASGSFFELIEEYFTRWSLTPAERDVALFAIKGLNSSEIAEIRSVSEGTVKAQMNAIYRKAGVGGRSQLLGIFIEELLHPDGRNDAPAQSTRSP